MTRPRSLVFNVGLNDSGYKVYKDGKCICPFYMRWKNMLARVYGSKKYKCMESYKECVVCDDWLVFSSFKSWMEAQDWQGKELDKDLLSEDSKVYSPETCCFITKKVNRFIIKMKSGGVSFNGKGYNAVVYNGGSRSYVGYFSDIASAKEACSTRRREISKTFSQELPSGPLREAFIHKFVLN